MSLGVVKAHTDDVNTGGEIPYLLERQCICWSDAAGPCTFGDKRLRRILWRGPAISVAAHRRCRGGCEGWRGWQGLRCRLRWLPDTRRWRWSRRLHRRWGGVHRRHVLLRGMRRPLGTAVGHGLAEGGDFETGGFLVRGSPGQGGQGEQNEEKHTLHGHWPFRNMQPGLTYRSVPYR